MINGIGSTLRYGAAVIQAMLALLAKAMRTAAGFG
jgi:hypothetical protein